LLRDLDTHKAHATHLLDGSLREFPAFVEFSRDRDDLILRKITCGIAYHFVFFSQGK
jgi:hypothetical protein